MRHFLIFVEPVDSPTTILHAHPDPSGDNLELPADGAQILELLTKQTAELNEYMNDSTVDRPSCADKDEQEEEKSKPSEAMVAHFKTVRINMDSVMPENSVDESRAGISHHLCEQEHVVNKDASATEPSAIITSAAGDCRRMPQRSWEAIYE